MENKKNLLYFDASSMKELHKVIEEWQNEKQKRLLSFAVEKDGDLYCCLGLSNPTEVTIVNEYGSSCHGDGGFIKVTNY
jgi:hypothetical protein